MGFFSEIVSEARRGQIQQPKQTTAAPFPPAMPSPEPVPPTPEMPSSSEPEPAQPAPEEPAAVPEPQPVQAHAAPGPDPAEAPRPPEQSPGPQAIDLTPDADAADDTARRKAHEAAEAKRKAEWDAEQAEKKAAEQSELDKLAALSDDDASRLSAHRVAADVEKITRRNMKEQVADHVRTLCLKDPAFARRTMHPRKSMIRCFRYIARKAYEYVKDELEADGIRPGPGSEGYGCDVPDDLCFQWAEDYFNDPDAEEDKPKEETFTPRPYIPSAKTKTPGAKKKQAADKKPPKPKSEADAGQITLGGFAPMEAKAG